MAPIPHIPKARLCHKRRFGGINACPLAAERLSRSRTLPRSTCVFETRHTAQNFIFVEDVILDAETRNSIAIIRRTGLPP
jgi:hypothetical protein